MKQSFLQMLRGLSELDFEKTANYQIRLRIKETLINKEKMNIDLAREIAGSMTISVPDSILEDEAFVNEIVERYAGFIMKSFRLYSRDFGVDAFRKRLSDISLKMSEF